MADTAAERARRYRRHRKGDHSLCDASRCDITLGVTSPVTQSGPVTPSGLGVRGRKLWRELHVADRTPLERTLVEEACRIADRLDKLDQVLRGDPVTWLRLAEDVDSGEITLVIDKALAEARQQAVALKQIAAELRQAAGRQQSGTQKGSTIDDLAARRAARRAGAAGL